MSEGSGPSASRSWLGRNAVLDDRTGVWKTKSGATVAYPNDDFAEHSLEGILRAATDLSSLSPELSRQGDSWPASYYLSPRRTNLLRGFDWPSGARVLEVGAGCGSITRFLGETFAEVVAVEGQPRRAEMARLRTRDLANVEVLNAPIQDVSIGAGFDFVFCIGVLEYASSFVEEANPYESMLRKMRGYLGEGGALVLAIENQMGLKYFAGSSEDHSGIEYDGIEGYRRSGHSIAHTFSKRTLSGLLGESGFGDPEFFFPFPDYKLVDTVATEPAFDSGGESLSSFLMRSQPVEYNRPPAAPRFDQRAVLNEALEAGIAPELSNSFLVVAPGEAGNAGPVSPSWDAIAFTIGDRRPEFWTRSEVEGIGTGNGIFRRRPLLEDAGPVAVGPITSNLPYEDPWLSGLSLATAVVEGSKFAGYGTAEAADELRPWIEFLHAESDGGQVGGEFLDAIPQNLIPAAGGLTFIDREISWRSKLPLRSIVIRGVLETLAQAEATPGAAAAFRGKRLWPVTKEICDRLGVPVGSRDLYRATRLEVELQGAVRGTTVDPRNAAGRVMVRRIEGRGRIARFGGRVGNKLRRILLERRSG